MNNNGMIEIVKEAIVDWRKGKLTDGACCFAIAFIVEPQPEPTARDIYVAGQLAKGLTPQPE